MVQMCNKDDKNEGRVRSKGNEETLELGAIIVDWRRSSSKFNWMLILRTVMQGPLRFRHKEYFAQAFVEVYQKL